MPDYRCVSFLYTLSPSFVPCCSTLIHCRLPQNVRHEKLVAAAHLVGTTRHRFNFDPHADRVAPRCRAPGNLFCRIAADVYRIMRGVCYHTGIYTGREGDARAPWSPTRTLVTGGLYGYVRNPMIEGVLLTLLGEAAAVESVTLLLWAGAFFIICNVYFVLYEEPSLRRRFGDQYLSYKQNVPRWIPRLKPFNSTFQ